jgi:dipeptidyl aminopeptidase/acylaminoacyl peptidase
MEMQLTSASTDFAGSEEAIQFWRRLIGGDSTKSASELTRAVSPVNMAASIKQPVFLIAGASDRRTPIEQTRAMQSALERAGNRPRVLIKADEGHGYGNVENRVEQYSEMLKFFEQHIGTSAK